jgi:hypothetical protein
MPFEAFASIGLAFNCTGKASVVGENAGVGITDLFESLVLSDPETPVFAPGTPFVKCVEEERFGSKLAINNLLLILLLNIFSYMLLFYTICFVLL